MLHANNKQDLLTRGKVGEPAANLGVSKLLDIVDTNMHEVI